MGTFLGSSYTSGALRKGLGRNWEPLDFEVMYDKLLAYREVHGHPNVPVKYQEDMQLGGWVSEADGAKSAKEEEETNDANDVDASSNNGGNTNHPSQQRYLTPE